ncbi:P63C domain-containing protein, partial [Rhodoferax sp.]|uniref:P63C domain-containing protein n=1 Tax=Rhodoferax sp. TaxID=50421 RepID=UPI00374DEB4E
THAGEIRFGDEVLPCFVLEGGHRVLTTRGMMSALGRSWRGRKYSGTQLPVFLEAKNLFPLIINELDPVLKQVNFVTDKGIKAEGFDAALLPMVCEIYLQARQSGLLVGQQQAVAQRCEMLVRSLAKVGITALIDEATGYQQVRDRDALQSLLDKYLLQEHAAWAKRFPDGFYKEMFRLKNWEFPNPSGGKPGVVGKYTLDIVYERLAPGLVDELKERNPKSEAGHRKTKHHQWLTDDVGHPALTNHIHAVMGLMRASKSWDMFKVLLDAAFPKKGTQFRLAMED